jgi:hypothetical protein
MAQDWESLMNDFAGSATQLVAEVDCTAAGEELCTQNGVEGFPTIKVSRIFSKCMHSDTIYDASSI